MSVSWVLRVMLAVRMPVAYIAHPKLVQWCRRGEISTRAQSGDKGA
jgi:hypothetical protein